MKLKVGDVVEFKKYEDMNDDERMLLSKDSFPSFGTVEKVFNSLDSFCIKEKPYSFDIKSVVRVIGDVDDYDLSVIREGDEVLVKAIVEEVFDGFIKINPSVDKTDVTKILKRKEPEHFIVKENYYGMYVGEARKLVSEKSKAKIYSSRDTANEDAAESMFLKDWKVIPYDD